MEPVNQQRLIKPNTSPQNESEQPIKIHVPTYLSNELDYIHSSLSSIDGLLTDVNVQDQILRKLMSFDTWNKWIETIPALGITPFLVSKGIGIERDDFLARKMLVGLAKSIQPANYLPPYIVENLAVTEVIAEAGATRESHSKNDLPAPPHCAGFFEELPPHTCYFACVRPHKGGGAETTVLNLARVLDQAPHALIEEWSSKLYLLRTSKRLGEEIKPFKLLKWVEGKPFLRYRKEYIVGFEYDNSLKILEELVTNPVNHFIVPLKEGETLIHWNGALHSRMPQNGATPNPINERRKLIRCRTVPIAGWEKALA